MKKVLRLAIDLRALTEPFESGVTVYTRCLVQTLQKKSNLELELFYQARRRCPELHALFPKVRHIERSNLLFHFRSIFGFPHLPNGFFLKKPDLIFLPDRRPFYSTSIPLVMTIHDHVPEDFTWTLSWKSWLWHKLFSLKRMQNLCAGILYPSSTVAARKPQNMPTEVTHEGAWLAPQSSVPPLAAALKKRPFFLCISPADPRKRLDWVLWCAERFPKCHFAIVGLKGNDARFAKRKLKKLPNVFLFGSVSEGEKKWFLQNAVALLALSQYEGFDLPVLEAVRAKCPVILSEISVHQELYRTQRPMVKTREDLRLALYRALQGQTEVPVPRGEYTWEECGRRTLLLFRRVLANENGKDGGNGNRNNGSQNA